MQLTKCQVIILVVCAVIITILLLWALAPALCAPSIDKFVSGKASLTWVSSEHLLHNATNGDVIFLSGNTYAEKSIRWHTSSCFSHMALIIREKDEDLLEAEKETSPDGLTAFVWEADIGQGYKKGPRVMRLRDKLKRWKGSKVGMWKRYVSFETPSSKEILEQATKMVDRTMDNSMVSWFFADYPNSSLFNFFKGKGKVYCSELVAETLQNIGIMEKDHHPGWYSPESFASDAVKLKRGVYSTPLYFKLET